MSADTTADAVTMASSSGASEEATQTKLETSSEAQTLLGDEPLDEGAAQIDEALLPFDLSLHFPDRPLLPSSSASLGLPSTPSPLKLAVQPSETLNDIRLTLADSPEGYWLGSYCFRRPVSASSAGAAAANGNGNSTAAAVKGEKVGEWVELKDVFEGVPKGERELHLTYSPFNEAEARGHVQRLRDLLVGGHHDPTNPAIDAGLSVQDAVRNPELWTKEVVGYAAAQAAATNKAKGTKIPAIDLAEEAGKVPFQEWAGWEKQSLTQVIPPQARPPRNFPTCLRSLAISAWSPPPQHLRARGHLLYLQIGTLEGETIFITASTTGFFLNKSSSSRFDPFARPAGEDYHCNTLFDLLCGYSPLFLQNFAKIFNEPLSARDFFAVLPLTNCMPASPWLARSHNHIADPLRPQTAYLLTGTTSLDSLEGTRDWNEEIQSARELPRSNLTERHARDRTLQRLYSEIAKSAANAVPKVAAGEVQALNPMDKSEAQMYCINSLFISRGVDGVDIYPYLGGDEAAHVAVSKDVQGIRTLNGLDIEGLCLLGTVIVDWHGERWVAQSIIPGLFRKKEVEVEETDGEQQTEAEKPVVTPAPATTDSSDDKDKKMNPLEDTQVVYGGVEGPEVIRTNNGFHKVFAKVAEALHLSKHSVKDAENKEHELWLSVDSKGLQGADGRKYALDVARLTPVDVEFLEKDLKGDVLEASGKSEATAYPHEMVLLRPELLELYYDSRFREWSKEEFVRKQQAKDAELDKKALEDASVTEGAEAKPESSAAAPPAAPQASSDAPTFDMSFNPDAFVKFKPPVNEASAPTEMITDESDPSVAAVRAASKYLRESAIPRLVSDAAVGIASAADGQALSRQMHIRGINMRYLGLVAHLASPSQESKLDAGILKQTGPGYEVLLKTLRHTAIQEMVLRAAKRLLNAGLKTASATSVTACVSHFLNCLLGSTRESKPVAEWTPSPYEDASVAPAWTEWKPETLFEQIQIEVRKRFRFELPEGFLSTDLRKPQMLRELSIRCGIQLKLQDYIFEASAAAADSAPAVNGHAANGSSDSEHATSSDSASSKKKKKSTGAKKAAKEGEKLRSASQSTTFVAEDVLNLVPIIKDSTPTSKVAEDAFETGRMTMMSRDRELGVDLLLEGISFHETIYGMAHPETARCYAVFAAIVHQFSTIIQAETQAKIRDEQEKQGKEDVQVELPAYVDQLSGATALRYQRQAVTISERAMGLDHAETLAQWASLTILERAEGNFEAALRCQKRVLELQDIIYGAPHPDNVTALSNLATTLQSAGKYDVSLKVFQSAHQLCLQLFGPDSINTGNLTFELCQAQSLVGDLRVALETLKESVRIFEARLGKEHPHTKEAELFLNRLAAAAVRAAKMEQLQSQQQQNQKILREVRGGASSNVGGGGGPGASTAAAAALKAVTGGKAAAATGGASASSKKTGPRPDPEMTVEELVKFISGGSPAGGKSKSKGKGKASTRS